MLTVEILTFNPFQLNTHIIYDETGECVIIDAGNSDQGEDNRLYNFITSNKLKPVRLINTHCHIDHILGNRFLFEKFKLNPECHGDEKLNLDTADGISEYFGVKKPNNPPSVKFLKNGEKVFFGNSFLEIIFTPGHSPGHIVLYSNESKFLISGDVLFFESIGRTDLPGGNYQKLLESIKSKLFILPDDVTVYPGHGQTTSIGHEKRNNPFIRD